jgi:hypothetical protein
MKRKGRGFSEVAALTGGVGSTLRLAIWWLTEAQSAFSSVLGFCLSLTNIAEHL